RRKLRNTQPRRGRENVVAGLEEAAVWGGLAFLLGAVAGTGGNVWAVKLSPLEGPAASNTPSIRQTVLAAIGGGLLTAAFTLAVLVGKCQNAEMVRPSEFWGYGRIVYHSLLLWLLLAATITDLRDYIIP